MPRHPGVPTLAAGLPPALRGMLWGLLAVGVWGLCPASARAGVTAASRRPTSPSCATPRRG